MTDVDTYLNRCYDILARAHDDIQDITDTELHSCEFMVKHHEDAQPELATQPSTITAKTGT